ncbi:MAG: LD-carboxypeptidase [Candidatus Brocadiae bacterium]|nr:LD-carboxypeptidase [Candidatus Brocadiia bacterium]
MLKPPRLRPGDTVAAVSLSWGGPGACPERYRAGKRQCEEEFGLRVVETRHALRDAGWLAAHPKARAEDLMEAFADRSIRGVISTIGGDDSIRLLPYIDPAVIRANPKVFMGFSDTTVTHFACMAAGLNTFYGPSFMAGFAENCGMHRYLADSVRRTLFEAAPVGEIRPNTDGWTVERLEWSDPALQNRRRALLPSTGWRWLQGTGVVRGPLIGGCVEVLEWLKGTPIWPSSGAWDGAVLFLETSEEAPPARELARWLRSYGAQGILQRIGALLLGRPGGHLLPVEGHEAYDAALIGVVREELSLASLPVVTGMDFGHTEPFCVLPYGVAAEVDCAGRRFSIVEPAVI